MQKYVLVFKSLIMSSLLVHPSRVPCEYNGTRKSIEWFCILDEILRASAMLPLSDTVSEANDHASGLSQLRATCVQHESVRYLATYLTLFNCIVFVKQ